MLTHGIRTLFLAQSAITTLAPNQTVGTVSYPAVFCDNARQGFKPPYIVVTTLGTDPMTTLDTYSESLRSEEIEVDVVGYSVVSARTLSKTVRQFFDDYAGAAGSDDTIKAVIWQDETYTYDYPDEGADTKYHIITTSYQVQYT